MTLFCVQMLNYTVLRVNSKFPLYFTKDVPCCECRDRLSGILMKRKEAQGSSSYLIRGINPGFLVGTEENHETNKKIWMIRTFTSTDEALQTTTDLIFISL